MSSTTFNSKSYETLKSEIYFALDVVKNHYSLNSAADKGELFHLTFKGHQSAEEFGMSAAELPHQL